MWLKERSAGIEMTHILRTTLATLHWRHSLFFPQSTQAHRIEAHILISSQTQFYNLLNTLAIMQF